MTEFPKWKYHDSEAACIVDTAEAEAALGADWRDTPDNRDLPEDEPADELANLRAEAEAKGIKVDARWGVKRLAKELAA